MWSQFEELDIHFNDRDFRETLDGGQSFRWNYQNEEKCFLGVFERNVVKLRLSGGKVGASYYRKKRDSVIRLKEYLDFDTDYRSIAYKLSDRDEYIKKAYNMYPNLRILRQSPAEAIVSFICSSSKRIVQIKQCVELLSRKLGERIGDDFYSIPSFERIANSSIDDIKECKLGFRSEYLHRSANKIMKDKFPVEELGSMRYAEAKKYLLSLHGIGEKVADCILLFGGHHFEAFPMDTWIRKAMVELYDLGDFKEARVFANERYMGVSGYAQQLLFSLIRNGGM